ncbi:MAG: tetratricopeptide repeat protein [bacterium]|nr:tetratricopeptide repeat protein [bacterium]
MNLAEQLEMDEKYEAAYAEYKKELPHRSNDIELLTKLGHIALILNNKNEAKAFYGRILELDPSNILAHEQLIDLFCEEDKFKHYLLKGNMYSLQQQFSHAKSAYKKAIDSATDLKEGLPARFLYAGICEEQGKYQDAIDEYLKISDVEGSDPLVFIKLAELYEKTEGLYSAVETLERAVKERGYAQFEEILAGYYIRNSQPDKAYEITKNDLTKARALMDMGKNSEAFEILDKVRENFKTQPLIHSLLAQYYFQEKQFENAFAEIDEYEKLDSNSPLIYQMRALIYEELDDGFNEHICWAKYNNLKGNKDVALNEYMMAYQFNDSDVDLIETIASQLETTGDKTKACEFYERLVDLQPNSPSALQKIAEFRESIGDYTGAIDYMEQLKSVDPRNSYVEENYERLQNRTEMGGDILGFFKKIFGNHLG